MSNDKTPARPRANLVCAVTGESVKEHDAVPLSLVRESLRERIRAEHPQIDESGVISRKALAHFRRAYIEELLQTEHGEFTALERQVTQSLERRDTISANIEREFGDARTTGERMSDALATFGGSWSFLIAFALVLAVWIAINAAYGANRAFDPYPFILLNLVLSCVAAVQAPIIMMSQRRQEEKDRLRALNDYRVNLKAELEVHHLHEKLDFLIERQWRRLEEIQQLQIDLIEESRTRK